MQAFQVDGISDVPRYMEMLERGDFDLVAVGRALITNPNWSVKIRAGAEHELLLYSAETLN